MSVIETMAAVLLIMTGVNAEAGVAKTSAIFLQQPFGARPFAMGQAYSALGDDVFALGYNPAALSRMKESQAATQFTQSLVDSQMGYLGLATPLNPYNAVGLSLAYLDAGKADIYDGTGNLTRTVSAERDFLLHLGFAHAFGVFGGRLHLGGAGKVLKSTLAEEAQATAYAGDAGSLYEIPWGESMISGALSISNLGPRIHYSGGLATGTQSDPLPTTGRAGLGYSGNAFRFDRLSLGIDVDRIFGDNRIFEGIGVEYAYHQLCALRFGYRLGQDTGALTFGVGLYFKNLAMDYGIGLAQALGNIQQFSLSYHFTIPGITYSASKTPTSVEVLTAQVQGDMANGRYFQAYDETQEIKTFFPENPAVESLTRQIQSAIDEILRRGQGGPRYHYAVGFNRFNQTNWTEAFSNLTLAQKEDPGNHEISKYLAIADRNLDAQNKQSKLQSQARIATLLELATQAFNEEDYDRATRLVREILRLGPYQPGEDLRARIEAAERRPTPKPVAAPPTEPQRQAPSAPISPTASDKLKAEQLYYAGVQDYLENNLDQALGELRQARRLDPSSTAIRNALERLERELNQRNR